MAQNIVYLGKCSLCPWKESVFCWCLVSVLWKSTKLNWLTVLFKSSISLIIFCVFILSISEKRLKISDCNCGFVYLSLLFYIFLFLCILIFYYYILKRFRIITSSQRIDIFIIMKWLPLFLLIFLPLKSPFSDTRAISAFF